MMKYGKQLVLALLLGGLCLTGRNIHAQENAFFREVSGTVEIRAPGSAAWASAARGDRIEKNTLISTGFRSTAVVVLGNSVITVRPLTRLSLDEIIRNQNEEQVNVSLQTGRIRAEVNPPSGGKTDFTVRSPTATASVRGTVFEVDTENLRVDEGRVIYFLDNGRQTSVAAGGTSYVDITANTVISSFEAAAELLVPALPPGTGSGSPVGDNSPVITPPPDVRIGFTWE
jgi:ferric-dicitrate binding protein FerR (iron transport regulator)